MEATTTSSAARLETEGLLGLANIGETARIIGGSTVGPLLGGCSVEVAEGWGGDEDAVLRSAASVSGGVR